MPQRWLRHAWMVLALMLLSACATAPPLPGPRYAEVKGSLPELAQGISRIFFYREDKAPTFNADIKLDGVIVGQSMRGGFFYKDVAPGKHVISCKTEAEKVLSLMLEPGQVRFVKTEVSMGWVMARVTPVLVDEAEGWRAIENLGYQAR